MQLHLNVIAVDEGKLISAVIITKIHRTKNKWRRKALTEFIQLKGEEGTNKKGNDLKVDTCAT